MPGCTQAALKASLGLYFSWEEDFKKGFELNQMILSSLNAGLDPPSQQHDAPTSRLAFVSDLVSQVILEEMKGYLGKEV